MSELIHLLIHVTGSDNGSGLYYLFWSGFGSDLGMFVAIAAFLRHRNCHVRSCWRLGRHPVEGTNHVVCRKHHPEDHLKPSDLRK